jgi:LCP family protein required for cell wall assembly
MRQEPGSDERRPRRRRRRVVLIVLASLLGLLLIASAAGVLIYNHLNSNIGHISVGGLGKRPVKVEKKHVAYQAMDVLLIGSDTRKGQKGHIVGATPGLSDTTIVLHLSADRKHAYAVSIPRDSMVKRPACTQSNGSVDPPSLTQFNDAYAIGGARCTLKTVEALTNIHLDHVVVIDFNGFRKMVDALGGVQVCLPHVVDDNIGHIHLKAGTYTVKGDKALDYVRVRHGIGDGGDIGRIARQQAFLASLTHKAVSTGTLTNPKRLYSFLDAVTSSISADTSLGNLKDLFSLGQQVRGIGLDNVRFLTVPVEAYPPDPNRLQWREPEANQLWLKLRRDDPLGSKQTKESTSAATRKKQTEAQKQRAAANGLCS